MSAIISEPGRSARIGTRFHKGLVTAELNESSLDFSIRLFGIKSQTLLQIPVSQIVSMRRVNERGIESFEVSSEEQRNICWFDTTKPTDWERALESVGIAISGSFDVVANGEPER